MSEAGERLPAAVDDHGGSLDKARALFPGAPEPFIDLSTGINPHSYPVSPLTATSFTRLPEPAHSRRLAMVAAAAYGAPDHGNVVPAPGTQILLPLVAGLVPPGRAAVLGPTYAEHARCAALAGHAVQTVARLDDLAGADLAIVVNLNNLDGRLCRRGDLLDLARDLDRRGGLLVVDEAFMDVGPAAESLCGDVTGGVVVLRSFGKFFGLAGLRLGFAVADPRCATRLSALLGPWAVSGPALDIGIAALGDRAWQDGMRLRLAAEAARLDDLLATAGCPADGGTALFRHVSHPAAPRLFQTAGRHGILLRVFAGRPGVLRIGLPGEEAAWARLRDALRDFTTALATGDDP